jgi:hypothetical protein
MPEQTPGEPSPIPPSVSDVGAPGSRADGLAGELRAVATLVPADPATLQALLALLRPPRGPGA